MGFESYNVIPGFRQVVENHRVTGDKSERQLAEVAAKKAQATPDAQKTGITITLEDFAKAGKTTPNGQVLPVEDQKQGLMEKFINGESVFNINTSLSKPADLKPQTFETVLDGSVKTNAGLAYAPKGTPVEDRKKYAENYAEAAIGFVENSAQKSAPEAQQNLLAPDGKLTSSDVRSYATPDKRFGLLDSKQNDQLEGAIKQFNPKGVIDKQTIVKALIGADANGDGKITASEIQNYKPE